MSIDNRIREEIRKDEYHIEKYAINTILVDFGCHKGLVAEHALNNGAEHALLFDLEDVSSELEKTLEKYADSYTFYQQCFEDAYKHIIVGDLSDYCIKIDVQGAERLLVESPQTFHSGVLMIEWHEYKHNIPSSSIINLLDERGYSLSIKKGFDSIDQEPTTIIVAHNSLRRELRTKNHDSRKNIIQRMLSLGS